MKDMMQHVSSLGMTQNEGRVFLELLKTPGQTGYELAKKTSIQRASVYQIMHRLTEMCAVYETTENGISRFIPEQPDKIGKRISQSMEESIAALTAFQKDQAGPIEHEGQFFSINNYEDTFAKIRELIGSARKSIQISTGWKEISKIVPVLRDADARGVEITVFSISEIALKFGKIFSYGLDEEKTGNAWKYRRLILVVDHKQTLIAQSEPSQSNRTLWTTNPVLVDIAFEHITHDIYILQLKNKLVLQNIPDDVLVKEHRKIKQNLRKPEK